ncbi:bacteriocin class II family protein [Pararhodonellum marinum]|uniref:bacteriocin class II family protein n=1 Tax=Pararhodonellum marinum TaxID=2755358 RepID=UPI0018909F80|nr:bacteriocin class II family protein [Pararhodonellum marinum]
MEKFKELSFEEMQEVEGGYWQVIAGVLALAILTDIALNTRESIDVFTKGFNDARN